MQGTKKQIESALVFSNDEQEYILLELPLKWEQRTKAQNSTFHMCFWRIAKHMWTHLDEVKQNCMKALFGIRKSKLWGIEYENAIIASTTQLKKDQAILLIETLIKFWQTLWLWELVTSREKQTLFYN